MALNRPNQLTTAFANAGLKNDIPQSATGSNLASYEEGFPVITMQAIADGGMPPQGQDFNGMFYTLTDIARYAQAGGLYPFDKEFCTAIGGYPLGAILTSLDGEKLYINQVNGNTNDPNSNTNGWKTFLTADQIDAIPTDGSGNPVASNGVFDALATKQNTLTFDNAPTSGSINPVTSGGIKTALDAKQDTLTFDSTPTADSNNPVTSQGIKAAIDAKDSLPSQTGHAGEYLKTDGETASWSNVESLPSQTGNAGKVLTTDGTTASWQPAQSRNVGEYVWSALPLTDAGLHLLDGSLIAEGGIYDAFVQHVAGLASSYPNAFCTETEWQASVNTYGSCGKFVYTQGTGVRLPKVSDILQGTTDVTAVGDLIEAGLPNITGKTGRFAGRKEDGTGALRTVDYGQSSGTRDEQYNSSRITFDASLSNPIYGKSTTVQPQSIKALLYICVATSVKTQIQVDIDNIATDLNSKAKRDLSNVTGNAVERVVASSTDYVRYESGLQICWGKSNYQSDAIITYPKPFADLPGVAVGAAGRTATEWQKTNFKLSGSDGYCTWIAIGRWTDTQGITTETVNVTPKISAQTITPSDGYNYISQVNVAAIPYTETDNSAGGKTVSIADFSEVP